jgi:hypothetical protein
VYPDLLRPAGRHDRSSACGRDSSPRTAARLPIIVTGGASTSAMPSPSLPLPNSNVVNQTRPIVQSRPVPSAPPPSGRWRACRRACRRAGRRARRAVDGGPGPAGPRMQPGAARRGRGQGDRPANNDVPTVQPVGERLRWQHSDHLLRRVPTAPRRDDVTYGQVSELIGQVAQAGSGEHCSSKDRHLCAFALASWYRRQSRR